MNAAQLADEAVAAGASQKPGELAVLIDLVADLQPMVILEIGSMNGDTLRAWQRIAPDALLISISLPCGPFGGGRVPGGIASHLIPCDSHDPGTFAQLHDLLAGRPIDFLFIDGDHSYGGVKQDFDVYGALVREGGIIALHDILFHPGDSGIEVQRFWRELEACYETDEICEPHLLRDNKPWGGIGVVYP